MTSEKRLIDASTVYELGHRTPFHIGIADLCDLKELLADVPTVDAVEVVHGQWITSDYNMDCECSICGGTFEWWEADEVHFCPNCGAKMDGDGNG